MILEEKQHELEEHGHISNGGSPEVPWASRIARRRHLDQRLFGVVCLETRMAHGAMARPNALQ